MDSATMLSMLKIELGIVTTAYDTRLAQLLTTAAAMIEREGAALATATSIEDANLVVMYAAWMWRKRDTGDGMPRMLRWALNNRIFSEKASAT